LKRAKEELQNKDVEISKLQRQIKIGMMKLQEMTEISRLRNYSEALLKEVKRLKEEKKHHQTQNELKIIH
jgi:hypothetical protein